VSWLMEESSTTSSKPPFSTPFTASSKSAEFNSYLVLRIYISWEVLNESNTSVYKQEASIGVILSKKKV